MDPTNESGAPSSGDAASPGTNAAAPEAVDPAAARGAVVDPAAAASDESPTSTMYLPSSSTAAVGPIIVTTTTATTTLAASVGGGGGSGGGGLGPASGKGGWNNGETEDILPWILCFGIGLIVIWIGWMLRQVLSPRLALSCFVLPGFVFSFLALPCFVLRAAYVPRHLQLWRPRAKKLRCDVFQGAENRLAGRKQKM